MKKAAKIIVKGTVQGVFYRQFIKDHADKLKLTGFVRNLDDGDVEIIVEGDADQIARLARFAKEGPQHAQIRSADVSERKWTGSFKEFKVLRI